MKIDLQLFSDSTKKKSSTVSSYISKYGNPLTGTNSTYSDKAKQAAVSSDSRFLSGTSGVKVTSAGNSTIKSTATSGSSSSSTAKTQAQKEYEAQNIYKNILNNGGSYSQAANAVKNATGISNYQSNYSAPIIKNTSNTDTGGDSADTGGGSGGSYTASTASFTPSETYLKAMEYTNQLLQQLSSGRTSYTDQINSLMDKISNRDAFSYDPDTDTLFQNELSSAMQSGKTAMQDTMGQAAALTGGYGSTYATAAANQAYNSYIQDAYNNLPDYYNLALEAYENEGNDLYNQLSMYQTADDTEYNRLATAYSANSEAAANIYDQEYNNYWQTQNFNESSRQWAAEQAQSQSNWEKEYALNLLNATNSSDSTSTESTKSPTQTQITKAVEAYNSGGDGALNQYLATLPDNVDIDEIMETVYSMGTDKRDYQISKDTFNWFGGLDNNDEFTDEYGTVTVKELYNNLLAMGYSEADAKAYINNLYNK